MSRKTFIEITTVVFTLVAFMHLFRIIYGWPAFVANYQVPMYLSWLIVVMTVLMVYAGLRELKK